MDMYTQRIVLACCCAVTILILAVDAILFKLVGSHATISCACVYLFDRWPVTYTIFVAWVCILIGHLMPTR